MEDNQLDHKHTRASDYNLESLALLYQLNLSIEEPKVKMTLSS